MESLPIVSVRGNAELQVPPEYAQITAWVLTRGRTRDQAEARLVELSRSIEAVLDPLAAALRRREASAVWISPVLRGKRNTVPERFEGRRKWTIDITDFSVLPRLLGGLTVGDEVTISGPYWRLEVDSPAYQRARLAAVQDAVSRASAYAAAFGSRIERLVEVSDVGMSSAMMPVAAAASGLMRSSAERSAPIEELDLSPVDQSANGSIEARFTMSAPDLAAVLAADPSAD